MRLRQTASVFITVGLLLPIAVHAAEETGEPAIGGYCPVTYLTKNQAVQGQAAHQAVHAGKLYYFANEDAKKAFLADPMKYIPQFDGLCTTALGGMYGNRLPSDPTVFEVREGKLYLFSSQRAKAAYDRKPAEYIKQGEERFTKPALGGICLVTVRRTGKAVKGQSSCPAVYRGYVYHFVDAEAEAEFLKDPQSYLAQFDNYCAVGVSRGKKYPADGSRVRSVGDKTYVLFDAEAEKAFDADPGAIIKLAETQWPTIKNLKDK